METLKFGIRLAFGRTDHAEEFVLAELLVSVNGQVRDPRLLALFDFKPDEQVALVALVIVEKLALHLDVMETVGIVKRANRRHIVLQQRGRISSRRRIRGGLNLQSARDERSELKY